MVKDLVSMTPLAEYCDLLYTRLAIEMPKHEGILSWWVELHPPHPGLDEGVGWINLKAHKKSDPRSLIVSYQASMHAVEHGAKVSVEVLEAVVEHHIAKFVKGINDKTT